jgi:hypothetical protein
VNLDGYERWENPIDTRLDHSRRAVIAEFSFSRFVIAQNIQDGKIERLSNDDISNQAWKDSIKRLKPFEIEGLDLQSPLEVEELNEAIALSDRLYKFFNRQGGLIITRPQFPGCGFVDLSEGDVLVGSTLFEVKAVDRKFRSNDFRQLLTYAALNHSYRKYEIQTLGIFNPRRGIYGLFNLDELCVGVSGKHSAILLSDIIETISSGGISR